MGRSRWGSVRKLPSGRYQARYRIDGVWRTAPTTFRTKGDADAFLAATRADVGRGHWIDPTAGQIELTAYSERWLSDRPNLRPRTRDLYDGLLRLHILPELGTTAIGQLTPGQVRTWRAAKIRAGRPGPSTIAKCYRLLHAICATAVEDGLIPRNPCVIKGASVERPAERPVATIQQVFALADAIEPRYRAMALLATFCGLRVGELRALRQRNLDLLHRTVSVVEQYQQLADGTLLLGPPKTDAGRRAVAIPEVIVPELEQHLATWCTPGRDNLVFPGVSGRPFRTATLHAAWHRALTATGIDGLRFHDLRHTGNTLAAATGASTKELMSRMGHASPRAALIYQHATQDRDAAIAAGLSDLIVQAREHAGP
jgi:integrase